MSSEAFIRLCEVLEKKYGLQESLNIKVKARDISQNAPFYLWQKNEKILEATLS